MNDPSQAEPRALRDVDASDPSAMIAFLDNITTAIPRESKRAGYARLNLFPGARMLSPLIGEMCAHDTCRRQQRIFFNVATIVELVPTGIRDVVEFVAYNHPVGRVDGCGRALNRSFRSYAREA